MAKYKVLIGLDTPGGRLEADTVVEHTSIPSKSIKWLTDQGMIVLASGVAAPSTDETETEPEGDEESV